MIVNSTKRMIGLCRRLILAFLIFTGCLVTTYAQQRITGTVRDGSGAPLAGVTIIVKGTNQGTVTDVDGTYSLSAQQGQELEFSMIGMDTETIAVGTQTTIDLNMIEAAYQLSETVEIGRAHV